MVGWEMNDGGSDHSWNETLLRKVPWWTCESYLNLRIAGGRAQFRTKPLPNTMQERNRYASTPDITVVHKSLINSMEYSSSGESASHSVKKFFVSYSAWRFITVSSGAHYCTLSWTTQMQSTPYSLISWRYTYRVILNYCRDFRGP
jgi:hypothetical protein